MFRNFTIPAIVASLCLSVTGYTQPTKVIPSANTDIAGGANFSVLPFSPRSYQWLMDSTLLTTLMNDTITGISFRSVAGSTAWPTGNTTISNLDLYMGKAILIQNTTLVFATNQSGPQTQVRSGSLVIPAGSYQAGSTWGPVINFTTPYVYTGGNLSLLMRSSGFTGINRTADALGVNAANYDTLYKACYEASYTGTGTMKGNFVILRFTYSTTPLPVELVSFNCYASGFNADIRWESASEKNIKQYIVERSIDGMYFEALHTSATLEQSNGVKQYAYTDVDVFKTSETAFYRLKIVENDGTFKYSDIRKISNGKLQESRLIVYPNPVKNICNISYRLTANTDITCRIYDIAGKVVYSETFSGAKGGNSMFMDLSSFKRGYYVLKLKGSGIDDTYKFIKD